MKVATLDPFHDNENAIADRLHDDVTVLDALHIVKFGTAAVDEVRRRVQQDIHGHRGRKNDPLSRIRNILRAGIERLTDRQHARLRAAFVADDRHVEGWQSEYLVALRLDAAASTPPRTCLVAAALLGRQRSALVSWHRSLMGGVSGACPSEALDGNRTQGGPVSTIGQPELISHEDIVIQCLVTQVVGPGVGAATRSPRDSSMAC